MKIMAKEATYKVGSVRLQYVTVVTLRLEARGSARTAQSASQATDWFMGRRMAGGSQTWAHAYASEQGTLEPGWNDNRSIENKVGNS
jgi:hypothetical protein